ncbi:hypothetical protein [Proteiniclasticum ruminis]|uniref:Uncharacterized protein n=1 Tax=Proteiniclasticum ruminis TaxID=398199 RepID=A0A1G8SBB5_9CLOT|nr:hypothetical protein [Proteiniclasticum ruminis]SDJ26512.1 hypothetical protein SAMN05421804_11124 [Proteiniclasticum ruminis]
MKHLVMLAGMYYPHSSATGKCANQYVSLLGENYKIDVVFIQSGFTKYNGHIDQGQTLYSLSNWRLRIEDWLIKHEKNSKNRVLKRMCIKGIIVLKAIGRVQSLLLFPNNLRWFYKSSFRTLCSIHKREPIDLIFTVNSPFAAHLAGRDFKKKYPNVKWITYTADPFHVRYRNRSNFVSNLKYQKAINAEIQVLDEADVNFLSEEVYANCEELYELIKDKTFSLPYLLPNNYRKRSDLLFDSTKVNLVYAGRFYKDIRNPEYLLKSFLKTKNENLVMHLYASSDCETLINHYVKQSGGRIVRHDLVKPDEIEVVLNSADILLNVGNSIPEFKPSKTFEYISTCKPIINFYHNGCYDEVLDKYPLILQINTEDDEKLSAESIEEFSQKSKNSYIDKKLIDELYLKHSDDYIKGLLLTAIEKH